MVVVQFAAENKRELVVECMGWAESGRQITRFLVLEKSWVDRLDNLVSLWSNIWPQGLQKHWIQSGICLERVIAITSHYLIFLNLYLTKLPLPLIMLEMSW